MMGLIFDVRQVKRQSNKIKQGTQVEAKLVYMDFFSAWAEGAQWSASPETKDTDRCIIVSRTLEDQRARAKRPHVGEFGSGKWK